jgi:excisionase family DNA binding protein
MNHRWIASSDVARILHVSPKTVSRWARDGRLPFIRTLGGHRRYPKVEIERLALSLGGNVDDGHITRVRIG